MEPPKLFQLHYLLLAASIIEAIFVSLVIDGIIQSEDALGFLGS